MQIFLRINTHSKDFIRYCLYCFMRKYTRYKGNKVIRTEFLQQLTCNVLRQKNLNACMCTRRSKKVYNGQIGMD